MPEHYLTAEENAAFTEMLNKALDASLHCWTCTRLRGGSASMCCDYATPALVRAFDRVREAIDDHRSSEADRS